MIRLAAVISHPIQHFAPLFRELAAHPALDVRVFHCCDWGVNSYTDPGFGETFSWDVDLLSGYASEFLPIRRRPRTMSFLEVDNPDVASRLAAFEPDAIWLHGYGHRTIWRAAAWGHGRARLIHFGDSELVHARSRVREWIKGPLLRRHFGRCDAFITIGDSNEAYYERYGVPKDKMFRGAYPIDLGRFRRTVRATGRPSRSEIREKYGLAPSAVVAVLAGKLESRKRPLDFIDALAQLRREQVSIQGLVIGSGPLREAVERRIEELGLTESVRLSGFVNQSEMPLVLEAGDVLVSTSEVDPHPLVVSEGLAVGLPVVASHRVGCIGPTDSARPGVNALVYSCGDVAGLSAALRRLALEPMLYARMSRASLALAATQDASVTAAAVVRALGIEDQVRTPREDMSAESMSP
jgi:glycosyltransferase involved in cell wall biosynthesis